MTGSILEQDALMHEQFQRVKAGRRITFRNQQVILLA